MQHSLVDTVVLYGAFDRGDQHHEHALPIVRGMDSGDLPVGVVLDLVYAETFNAVTHAMAHEDCVEAAEMLEHSRGFTVERTNRDVWRRSHSVYRENPHLSFVDSAIAAYAEVENLDYLYSFDTGFDSVEGLQRLKTAENPYAE